MTRIAKVEPVKAVEEVVENPVVAEQPRRKSRTPFGAPRSKLSVAYLIEGYHLHWINDSPGRIHEAQQSDYEFVKPSEVGVEEKDNRVKRLVGTNEDGSALYAYLMKIRQDWYDEDQAKANEIQANFDDAIHKGRLEQMPGNAGYIPKEGISIRN
jgi:hypothetical protein